MLATVINKIWGWRVEVIDEENYSGPRDKDGLPDHKVLQNQDPADVVGFYCGLTSTIERVWTLASFYKLLGVTTLAGSWHAHYFPEETLHHNIDLIVHGDAELQILKVFDNISAGRPLYDGVAGVSYLCGDTVVHILPDGSNAGLISDCDKRLVTLENRLAGEQMDLLPYPDFGLLKYARIKIYPVGRIRGCSYNCTHCSVKGGPRFASPEWFFGMISWLVTTRKARIFFIVDDRSEEDLPGAIRAFKMIGDRFGRSLYFNVQMRLEAIKNVELAESMKRAGVRSACIGLESPIDEELKAMKKGVSAKTMLELLGEWRKIVRVHGMLIFGYPTSNLRMTIRQRITIFKKFFRQARLDYIQVLLPIPLPGSDLYNECRETGKLFPLSVASWDKYDGNFLLIKPDKGIDMREFQSAHLKIMAWFYSPMSFYRLVYRTLTFPLGYFVQGFAAWKSEWARDVILWIGHGIVKRWVSTREADKHLASLKKVT